MTSPDPLRARAEQIAREHAGSEYPLEAKELAEAIYVALSEVAQERDTADNERAERYAMEANDLTRRLMQAEAQLASLTAAHERVKAALQKHGRHVYPCPKGGDWQGSNSIVSKDAVCACGLDSALTLDGGASQA